MSPPTPSSEAVQPAAPPCVIQAETVAWFNEHVYRHDSELKSYLRKRFPYVNDMEDVVQESYVRTWKAKLVRQVENSKSFLFTVAQHVVHDILRKKQRWEKFGPPDFDASLVMDETPDAAQQAVQHERLQLLAQAIATLPRKMKETILLCRCEGLSQKEAAERMGISTSTVEGHVCEGLARMRRYFAQRRKP